MRIIWILLIVASLPTGWATSWAEDARDTRQRAYERSLAESQRFQAESERRYQDMLEEQHRHRVERQLQDLDDHLSGSETGDE